MNGEMYLGSNTLYDILRKSACDGISWYIRIPGQSRFFAFYIVPVPSRGATHEVNNDENNGFRWGIDSMA